MAPKQEIVITGVGVASPIGIEIEDFWASLCEGRSGVGYLKFYGELYDRDDVAAPIGAAVDNFEYRCAFHGMHNQQGSSV